MFCNMLVDRPSYDYIIFDYQMFVTHADCLKTLKGTKTSLTFWPNPRHSLQHRFGVGFGPRVTKRGHILTLYACVSVALCSSIHDHTDSHCFMKLLQGQLKETLFDWPEGKSHGDMVQKSQRILQENKVAYINGEKQDCVLIRFFSFESELPSLSIPLNSINCLCVWASCDTGSSK